VRRLGPPALLIGIGIVLLADLLVVNPSLAAVSGLLLDLVIVVAAGAALAGVAALAVRHAADLLNRRGNGAAAVTVLVGMGAMLLAGLRPGSRGATDPLVMWLVAALLVPLAASLFGLLFVSTLGALRRAVVTHRRHAALLAVSAAVVLLTLLPVGGAAGSGLSDAGGWLAEVPIGAVFRGLLLGVGLVSAVAAARTLLGIGADE
jgi:4-amino-4-deoxy-L-arabinose transferase-like glycosyltransferase